MNAVGQLQISAAELKRDIRTTTMGGFYVSFCVNLFSLHVPYLGLEQTIYVIKSQIHLVRQSL
jgi:hypothetical protein